MPTWRCPHCGTPQAETARCWVCRRSSTACGTCRHFRRSVAGSLGYCGLDRRRAPLAGDEIRACWEPRVPVAVEAGSPSPVMATTRRGTDAAPEHGRDFVEVLPGQDRVADRPGTDATLAADPAPPSIIPGPVATTGPAATAAMAEPRWNLWGDLEI